MRTVVMNLVMSMALMANVAWANNSEVQGDSSSIQVEIVAHKNAMVAVHYSTVELSKVKIKITNDDTNQIVYVNTYDDHKLSIKRFDMSHLAPGKYLVEVSNGAEVVSKFVQVQ